jgi:uncharacterized membrane protein
LENVLSKTFIVVAIAGVIDSIYTAYEYATESFGSCYVNSKVNCLGVFQSGHTSLLGIPFYVMGLVWFPLLLILGIVITRGGTLPLKAEILLPLVLIGDIFTFYLWYLELGVIGVICPLCVSLYLLNYILTGLLVIELL